MCLAFVAAVSILEIAGGDSFALDDVNKSCEDW